MDSRLSYSQHMSCFRLTVDVHGIVTYQIIISSYPFLSCKFACSDNQGPKWVVSERFLTWYHSIRVSPVGISSSPSVEHHTIIMIGKKSAILISCHDGILDSLGYGVIGSIACRTTGMGEEFSLGRPMGWDGMGWDGMVVDWSGSLTAPPYGTISASSVQSVPELDCQQAELALA